MSKRSLVVAGAVAGTLLLAACSSSSSSTPSGGGGSSAPTGGVQVGVILPDTASSARWEANDRPLLTAAFQAAGVGADIQNANGDVTKFQTIADQMIAEGVKVLMIVNLDSASGAAVEKKAAAAGIATIDYDRLTLGGGAKYYVSFDNVAVGTQIGEGLATCLTAAGKTGAATKVVELNGSPTDNNATLFKQGYDAVIKSKGYTIVADQSVPKWDNTAAGTLFEQIFTAQKGKIDGVASANDGLGGAVVAVLQRNGLAGKVPVTGQDATDEGLQRILLGTQCMSVYKAVKKEADAASALAIALIKGDTAGASALATKTVTDTTTGQAVPAVLLVPQSITAATVKDVVSDGFTTVAKVCTTAALQAACKTNGVS
jgi:D-xylose transport system substrate-binding protein